MKIIRIGIAILMVTLVSHQACADMIPFNFLGNAGSGLLPGNENPAVVGSTASGGETSTGLVYDDVLNTLFMLFDFSGMTSGLNTGAASGMHLHDAGPVDPLSNNGGIVFNLNSGADANVTNNSPLLLNGATSGSVDVEVVFSDAQEIALLNGQFYLNIHSVTNGGGELRGNLVVPEPATWSIIGLGFLFAATRRKRL